MSTAKAGAPKGNRNALRHGSQSFIVGKWPKGSSYICRTVRLLRREIEAAATEASGGELTLFAMATAQTASRHEARALLLQRWLRNEADKLDVEARARLMESIGRASDARDRCLKALGLDRREEPFTIPGLPVWDDEDPPEPTDATHGSESLAACDGVDKDTARPADASGDATRDVSGETD